MSKESEAKDWKLPQRIDSRIAQELRRKTEVFGVPRVKIVDEKEEPT